MEPDPFSYMPDALVDSAVVFARIASIHQINHNNSRKKKKEIFDSAAKPFT